MYPYNDEDMIYDLTSHRYILTVKAITKKFGDFPKAKYKGSEKFILDRVSALIYGYIHEHNDSVMQDYIIAKTKGGRDIIKEAMLNQFAFMVMVGDFSTSPDEHKRANYIDITAKNSLLKTIPEIGKTILYVGNLYYCSLDETAW